jgi:subtilisin family serine protease
MAKIDGVDERMDVDIAIIDSGIDLDHPDLNVFHYADCTNPQPNSCKDNDAGANDVLGHGTHVAGIAAAIDNNAATVGVAPGARLWAVKALQDNGAGDGADIIKAVDYIAQHGSEIEVVNMSLGGLGVFTSLDNAISNAMQANTPLSSGGVVFVVAAGNDAFNMDDPAIDVFPAEHPDVITVSAFSDLDGLPGALGTAGGWTFTIPCDVNDYGTNSCKCTEKADDSFACFSNYGSAVDLMAPGVRIKSSKAGGGTTNMFGTSMAAPHVAGVAALYAICNPNATPNEVRQGLTVGRPGDNGIECAP